MEYIHTGLFLFLYFIKILPNEGKLVIKYLSYGIVKRSLKQNLIGIQRLGIKNR